MVRNWQLEDGRVVILGHPGGKEMQSEVCVVVGHRKMHETIRKRHEEFNGVHMTNGQLLHNTENYQGCLSYDTTFFCGSSGSPVIEMNGNIVAMHTQGYTLTKEEDGQQEDDHHEDVFNLEVQNIPNQGQENVPRQRNTRTYSLMEFGLQFCVICSDIRRSHGEDVVRQIFPCYTMDQEERASWPALFNHGSSPKASGCIEKVQKNSIVEPAKGKCVSSLIWKSSKELVEYWIDWSIMDSISLL